MKVSGQSSSDSTTQTSSSLDFFPGPQQRGLPLEIRHMVYNEMNTLPDYARELKDIRPIEGSHWIHYEDTSSFLALLRSGHVWENDACSALEVQRATKNFTLITSWASLKHSGDLIGSYDHYLFDLLKTIDVVYAIDQEHQRTSTTVRKWTAPLPDDILKYGT